MLQACRCSWDIAGVDELPSHSHRSWARVRRDDRVFTIAQHDLPLNPGLDVLEQGDDILIWVDWREVARGLATC